MPQPQKAIPVAAARFKKLLRVVIDASLGGRKPAFPLDRSIEPPP
jgi:hypothetical protein